MKFEAAKFITGEYEQHPNDGEYDISEDCDVKATCTPLINIFKIPAVLLVEMTQKSFSILLNLLTVLLNKPILTDDRWHVIEITINETHISTIIKK